MHHDRKCAEHTLNRVVQRQLSSTDPVNAADSQDRLERCIVTYTHILTDGLEDISTQGPSLNLLFDDVFSHLKSTLSTAATHAIQTLLWRGMGSSPPTSALAWLQLLLHKLLHNCSDTNKARIQRKAMLMTLSIGDLAAARQIFFEMSTDGQNEALSQYIAFKIALQSGDDGWAAACLKGIASKANNDHTLLYACTIEAHQSSKEIFTVDTLLALVNSTPQGNLTPALLRCLARLMLNGLETSGLHTATLVRITSLFDQFVACLERQDQTTVNPWLQDAKWWSKHAYNLGLRCTSSSMTLHLVRLLKACTRILVCTMSAKDPIAHEEAKVKLRTCYYIITSASITSARGQSGDEDVLQQYAEARQEIDKFCRLCYTSNQAGRQQAFQMRRYELEAIIKLKQWQDLHATIAKCLTFDADNQWDKLADLALILHKELGARAQIDFNSHAPEVLELLQRSVNEMWKREKDVKQVARWLRTTMSIDLDINKAVDGGRQVTFKLLDQAATLAYRGVQGLTERYPDDELQWLASASFNCGVDYGIAGEEHIAWQLFDAALELARHANDNGGLHASLTARRAEASKKMR